MNTNSFLNSSITTGRFFFTRRNLISKYIKEFRELLREITCANVTTLHNINYAFKKSLEILQDSPR